MVSEKQILSVQLAGGRARLWHAMIGLPGSLIERTPVLGRWHVTHILANLSEYDEMVAALLHKMRTEQLNKHQSIQALSPLDSQLILRMVDRPLPNVLEATYQARTDLEAKIDSFPSERFEEVARYKLGDQPKKGTPLKWVRKTIKQEKAQAKAFVGWRDRLSVASQIGSKAVLDHGLKIAFNDFKRSAALVPAEQRQSVSVCGGWHLHDVVGHIADWDVMLYTFMREMCRELRGDYPFDPDVARFNRACFEQRRDMNQSWDDLWADMLDAHQQLLQKVETLTEAQINETHTRPIRSKYNIIYLCAWAALEHYMDHATVLRREINADVPKWLKTFDARFTGGG